MHRTLFTSLPAAVPVLRPKQHGSSSIATSGLSPGASLRNGGPLPSEWIFWANSLSSQNVRSHLLLLDNWPWDPLGIWTFIWGVGQFQISGVSLGRVSGKREPWKEGGRLQIGVPANAWFSVAPLQKKQMTMRVCMVDPLISGPGSQNSGPRQRQFSFGFDLTPPPHPEPGWTSKRLGSHPQVAGRAHIPPMAACLFPLGSGETKEIDGV